MHEVSQVWNEGSLELTEEIIRVRAHRLFEERGCEHGHDLDDWLRQKRRSWERSPSVP